jgi:hypothetical protein
MASNQLLRERLSKYSDSRKLPGERADERRVSGGRLEGFLSAAQNQALGLPESGISKSSNGGRTRARTLDPLIKSQLLYQLSYAPIERLASRLGRPAISKAPADCPAGNTKDLELRPRPLVLLFINKLVVSNPRHHRTKLRADLFDRMRLGTSAHGLERCLVDLVLKHPVPSELS